MDTEHNTVEGKPDPEAYGYYPGCSLHGTACEFEASVQEVARAFQKPTFRERVSVATGIPARRGFRGRTRRSVPTGGYFRAVSARMTPTRIIAPAAARVIVTPSPSSTKPSSAINGGWMYCKTAILDAGAWPRAHW